jgi:hypothetical protein
MQKQDEIRFYGEWAILISEYLDDHIPAHPCPGMRPQLVRKAMVAGNLRGLKMMPRDFFEEVRGLRNESQEELDSLLLEKFGVSLADRMKKERVAIGVVITRGSIEGDAELRLLKDRALELENVPQRAGELRTIRRLLAAFTLLLLAIQLGSG